MSKFVAIYLLFALAIAAILFRDLVVNIFRDMSPLDAMKQIVNYLLHIAVITILGSFLFGFYKVIQGWRRFVRGFSKRKPPQAVRTKATSPKRGRRLTQMERLLRLFVLMQRIPPPSARGRQKVSSDPDKPARLKF